jgi:hypothetical protein
VRPSHRQLDAAIDGLDPAQFQALAEVTVRRGLAGHFAGIARHGANSSGVTTRGWPDAYAVDDTGRLVVLETTRLRDGWRRHLDHDVERVEALGRGAIADFAAVVWATQPDPEEVAARWCKKLRQCGVDRDIHLLFRQRFVELVALPRFADVWREVLNLPCSALPFVELADAPPFGCPDGSDLALSPKEARSKLLDAGETADEVCEVLREQHSAVLLGSPGSAKTTTALCVGLRDFANALYIDAGHQPSGVGTVASAEALVSRADDDVVFIVDNAHLDPDGTRALHDLWRDQRRGSSLLVVGRRTGRETALGARGGLERIDAPQISAFVGPRVVHSVMLRQATRMRAVPPQLDQASLRRIAERHADDLIIFGASVAGAFSAGRSLLDLGVDDAAAFVRERYLDTLDATHRGAVLRVAALSALEVAVDDRLVDAAALRPALEVGLVREVTEDASRVFACEHAQLGHLLIEAAHDGHTHRLAALKDACADARLAARLLVSLINRDEEELAAEVLASRAADDSWLAALLAPGSSGSLFGRLELLERIGVTERSRAERALNERPDVVIDALAVLPPMVICAALGDLRRWLPSAYPKVVAGLDRPPLSTRVADRALTGSLDRLLAGLAELKVHLPNTVARIEAQLTTGRGLTLLLEWLLPLGHGSPMVRLRRLRGLRCIRDAVIRVLEGGRGRDRVLRAAAAGMDFGGITHAEGAIAEHICAVLTSEDGRRALLTGAGRSGARFTTVARMAKHDDELASALAAALANGLFDGVVRELVADPSRLPSAFTVGRARSGLVAGALLDAIVRLDLLAQFVTALAERPQATLGVLNLAQKPLRLELLARLSDPDVMDKMVGRLPPHPGALAALLSGPLGALLSSHLEMRHINEWNGRTGPMTAGQRRALEQALRRHRPDLARRVHAIVCVR